MWVEEGMTPVRLLSLEEQKRRRREKSRTYLCTAELCNG
jgi:hypothetical protein